MIRECERIDRIVIKMPDGRLTTISLGISALVILGASIRHFSHYYTLPDILIYTFTGLYCSYMSSNETSDE